MASRPTGKSGRAAKQADGDDRSVSAQTRILILHGGERFKQDEHLSALRTAMTNAHGAEGFDTVRFDGIAGARIVADVLDECRSMGLMAQFKVVIVDNADLMLKSDDKEGGDGDDAPEPAPVPAGSRARRGGPVTLGPRKLLEAYAVSPSPNAALVLRANSWRTGNLDKAVIALGPAGAVIKCDSPSEEESAAWAIERATAVHNTRLESAAATALISAVGSDFGRIDSELAKLALAAGGRGEPITEKLVASMTGITREDEHWGMQSRLIQGDAHEALEHLRLLLDVSRTDPVPIVWSYVDLARKVHGASRGLSQGIPRQQIISGLRMWGPTLDMLLAKATRIKPEAAARMLKAAIDVDAAGKSGQGDPRRNLEILTVKMCRAFRTAGAGPSVTPGRPMSR